MNTSVKNILLKNGKIKSGLLAIAIATTSLAPVSTAQASDFLTNSYRTGAQVELIRDQRHVDRYERKLRKAERKAEKRAERRAEKRAERQVERRADRRAERWADRRADRRFDRYDHRYDRRADRRWKERRYYKHDNSGRDIAIGVAGITLGAIILNEITRNNRPAYEQNYRYAPVAPERITPSYNSRTYNNDPGSDDYVVTLESGALQPWTKAWRDACRAKYRSFNVKTGTFRGYDGNNHFCVIK